MGKLFDYFAEHTSYGTFQIQEFLKIQNCPTKVSSVKNFQEFVESVCRSKSKDTKYSKAKSFANKIREDKFDVLQQAEFVDYWRLKEQVVTRAKLRVIEDEQTKNHVRSYGQVFGAASSYPPTSSSGPSHICSTNSSQDDPDYQSRESTPSSTSSNDETVLRKFYLVHDGHSYEYKLKNDASRWIVNAYDASDSFFKYREQSKTKAEDLEELNKHEQLSLDGIILIDNNFVKNDFVDFEQIDAVLDDIDNQAYFQQTNLTSR